MKTNSHTNNPANAKDTRHQITRRRFISNSASAAAFSIISPALVRGSQVNSRITVGMIGVGGRGAWIADHVAQHPGFQIAAVADYFPDKARAVGERLKVSQERCFSGLNGYARLLESKVDAVFLETPPWFFPAHARAAVQAGCHVYMAKPVAVDVPGCLSIRELGKRSSLNKKAFLVDFQTRADPFHIQAIELAHEGMLGPIGVLNSFYHDDSFEDPLRGKTIENLLHRLAWVNDTALGGSYIVNCDVHAIDVALWIVNDVPASAVGYSCRNRSNPNCDSHDCYAVTYKFRNGIGLSHYSQHVRNASGFKSGCNAYGQKAFLQTNYAGRVNISGVEDGYAGGENKDLYADGMRRNVDTFHKCVVDGIYDNPTVEPSVNSTLATILGREAASRGCALTWDDLLADTTRLELDLSGLAR